MQSHELLADAFGRVRSVVHSATDGLSAVSIAYRPEAGSNSIAWLVWHLTRIQDDHVAELAGQPQAWTSAGWHDRIGVPDDPADTGFGHTPEQVAALRPSGSEALLGYHDDVVDRTLSYLANVDAAELGRIIDRSYDPPVSVGVRLVSVLSDNLQHAGQARYLRGIVDRGTS